MSTDELTELFTRHIAHLIYDFFVCVLAVLPQVDRDIDFPFLHVVGLRKVMTDGVRQCPKILELFPPTERSMPLIPPATWKNK